jgi:hypothetical protein
MRIAGNESWQQAAMSGHEMVHQQETWECFIIVFTFTVAGDVNLTSHDMLDFRIL